MRPSLRLSAADISALKRVAAVVRGSSEFSVQRDRERMTATGAVVGSFLGAAIEPAARTNSDSNFAQTMKPALGDFNGIPMLRERLLAALRATSTFSSAETTTITDVATLRQAGFDALLDVEVPEWGLRLCTTSHRSDDLQVTYRVHGRLVATGTSRALWERHELFVDGDCRPADALRNEAGLLRSILARAADHRAGGVDQGREQRRTRCAENRAREQRAHRGRRGGSRRCHRRRRAEALLGRPLDQFWEVVLVGTMAADVTIDPGPSGRVSSARPVTATYEEGFQVVTEGRWESVLNNALAEFVRNFARDPAILDALKTPK